ncbi:hypothetical protein [Roseateles sp.]|uniref:hypothetical protein n=1 Tax=Roseateles sp. TaxID=1971397 RepID=UPI003D11F211
MNGLVHTGMHAIAQTEEGCPPEIAKNLVQPSYCMLHTLARLCARTLVSMK